MASTTQTPSFAPGASSVPPAEYFSKLAANYSRDTGDSTKSLFIQSLPYIQPPITSTSIVHDNAAGPGTASSVLLSASPSSSYPSTFPASIEITDNNAAMIAVASRDLLGLSTTTTTVNAQVMPSESLNFPSNHFTHSLLNFSIFAISDPSAALREIHRTLRPSGVAVITTWKRWVVIDIIHEIQRTIRPDLPLMRLPGPQFFERGVLGMECVKAGFEEGKVRCWETGVVLRGREMEDVVAFLRGPFTVMARVGWSEEEVGRWEEVMGRVVEGEVKEWGGLRMEGWCVVAEK